MNYYFSTILSNISFEEVIEKVTEALKTEEFGVLTDIDIQQTLKKKLGVDMLKYRILGACNPPYAYQALQVENKIGTMLPCNVIVREVDTDRVEVAAVNPVASMQAVNNPELGKVADEITAKLEKIIKKL